MYANVCFMNLKEHYEYLLLNPKQWEYYGKERSCFFLDNRCNCLNRHGCSEFIKDYLKRGEKLTHHIDEIVDLLPTMRLQHTVSCFFLGIDVYHNCKTLQDCINNFVLKIRTNQNNETKENRFYYIWFLTCLFHDIGYVIEDKLIEKSKLNIEKALIKEAINSLLTYKPWIRTAYTKKTIKKYLHYRKYASFLDDHGITGGALLFKKLRDLRKEKEKEINQDNSKYLYWGEELIKDFLVASQTIACHNIYKIGKYSDNKECYELYGLNELITDERIISAKKHSLLFLLCLVDSIEPMKTILDCIYLDKIIMGFEDHKISIDINALPAKLQQSYRKKVLDISSWLTDSKCNDNDNNIIIINF